MPISFSIARRVPARAEVHAVGLTKEAVEAREQPADWDLLASRGFEGEAGSAEITSHDGRLVVALGLGPRDEVGSDTVRRAGAALTRAASRHRRVSTSLLDDLPADIDRPSAAAALAEGVVLGGYSFDELKSKKEPAKLESLTLVGRGGARVSEALGRGARIAEAVNLARDLVNEPGGSLTPTRFAREATKVARGTRLKIDVLDPAAIKKARLGGLLGVSRGSAQPPRFVKMTYTPTGRRVGHLALVGKGITFDAGGLSIKPGAGMMTMKCDMSGAAAVLAAMSALADLGPPVKVSAYMPLTDNMLGGDATRPGDVLEIRNRKTVEVLNTDAEGRLVLADALSLASEAKPDAIVDLATLTGACVVALGPRIAGLMSNHDGWCSQVESAGERTGERVWPLPLPKDYRKFLDSPIADMKNIGGPHGGALTAGLFLQEFVADGIPWCHLDIAGPAFSDEVGHDHPKGGTGFGVRLLCDLVENFTPPA